MCIGGGRERKKLDIPAPKILKTISVTIIDDGWNVEFMSSYDGKTYEINETGSAIYARDSYHIAMFNRELNNNVVQITYLKVSVVTQEEKIQDTD